jgi:thiamine pyrophosphate-dependent acetolactate synthase large subunit-like protein
VTIVRRRWTGGSAIRRSHILGSLSDLGGRVVVRAEDPQGAGTGSEAIEWGSDALAELLSRLDLRYIALVPGSSYRGLHDSLVNYGGNRDPQMLVCLHEEHAVAVAHGYAKVTGRPMAVAVHSNVGLMHASMAIYNAYCDRVPMLIIGATGPVDAARRRPWIDWIHTSADQGALIRQYSKWDDQPASVAAALDSLARAYTITREAPSAPVYVCLDVSLQEQPLPEPPEIPDVRRDRSPRSHGPDAAAVGATSGETSRTGTAGSRWRNGTGRWCSPT